MAPIQGRGEQVLAVALRVADLSSAVDYYTNVLGFKVLSTLPGTEVSLATAEHSPTLANTCQQYLPATIATNLRQRPHQRLHLHSTPTQM